MKIVIFGSQGLVGSAVVRKFKTTIYSQRLFHPIEKL